MKRMITVKEAAKLWGLSETRVTKLCRLGRINGAIKDGRSWHIPADAEKPIDSRIKSGVYRKEQKITKLPLPIGISDYRLAVSEYYYVDKTMLIKEFIDERPMVSLFTRPRRFGKTLNMDMLRVFFEKNEEDTSVYFKDKKIWDCGKVYQKYQGKYPVIYVTFKDVKYDTWSATYDNICKVIIGEFQRHKELADSDNLSIYEKSDYLRVINGEASKVEMTMAFLSLSRMLHEHHGVAPIIIIDEYDTPIQQGHIWGFYDEVVSFIRNLFSSGLKDNRHLSYGFLTGILRVAKESIFSGLNNIVVNSVLDKKYSEYFGFTANEVKELITYYGESDKYDELCKWYDGYRFGQTDIFNPWSVINYINNDCQPKAYWTATSGNDIIGEVLSEATPDIIERLNKLMAGESILTFIDTDVIYPEIRKNPSSVYSFLVVCGYLKIVESELAFNGDYMCHVAIPNKEVKLVYRKEILQRFDNMFPMDTSFEIQEAIYTGNVDMLKTKIGTLLKQSVSFYDTVGESFYHGFMLGLCVIMGDAYLTSNRESGKGRYDIQLMPKHVDLPGVIIELKAEKACNDSKLKEVAQAALQQIEDNEYDSDMLAKGVRTIYKYGVAFSGKNVEIMMG